MKPLNLDNIPCSPISSNCVVWQGPDISCIEICNGDTVSDVVAALATELCTILDQTNVSNYDLSCLGITACGPKDFQALIQLLIEKICELQGVSPSTTKDTGACPDCVVTIAPCFRIGNQTTMQLLDYVQMIAAKVCSLIDEIANINNQITDILIRLEQIENTPVPQSEIPSFTLGCNIGSLTNGSVQFINIVLEEFINNVWCAFFNTTGSTSDLISAVNAICIEDTDLQLSTGTPFSSNPNWIDAGSYNTIADAINNIWVALCDVYTAVDNISFTVQDTNSIDLNYSGGILTANIQDTGWVDLNGFEFYAPGVGRPQCRRIGNVVHFRGTVVIPLETIPGGAPLQFNNSAGSNTYITQTTVAPSVSGAGSVYLDSNGAIYFNANNSVIPSSVVSPTASGGFYFDNAYVKPFTLGTRGILIENSVDATDLISTTLNTVGTLLITKDGKLGITIVRDGEEANVSIYQSNYSFHTSHLNYIISHVVTNEFVPNFQALATTVHSSAASGVQTVDIDHTQSGTWTIARSAPTTPLIYKYRFPFNGNDINSLGGVAYNLDGLMTYIDPCTTDIKSYNCPPA